MPKISATNSKGLFIGYFVKILFSTVLSIILFNCIVSAVILKFDISLSAAQYAGIAIAVLSSILISMISTIGFKNNYLLLAMISVLPISLFIIINMLVNDTNSTICIIKLLAVFASAAVTSLIKSAKKR